MGKPTGPLSEFLEAAGALEEELDQFGKLVRSLEKEPLASRKSIDRAGGTLSKIAESEEKLGPAMAGLMAALTNLRVRHEEQSESVKRRAEEIRQRTEVYRSLLERMGSLVTSAGELNDSLTHVSNSGKSKPELVKELDGVVDQIRELTAATDALRAESKEQRFEDVGRQADGLSEQLGNARSKLVKLQKELSR